MDRVELELLLIAEQSVDPAAACPVLLRGYAGASDVPTWQANRRIARTKHVTSSAEITSFSAGNLE